MKIVALTTAAVFAAAALTPTPVQAQRYGYHDRGYGDWNGGYRQDWRGDRRFRGHRDWRGQRGWRGRGRDRVRCVWVRGYYGPQRQCFRR